MVKPVKALMAYEYGLLEGHHLSEGGSTVLAASLSRRLLEKCMAGEGLPAQMVVDKYPDHPFLFIFTLVD